MNLLVMPAVITGLGESGTGRPVPVVSAMVEFGSALHVLGDPGHHDAERWASGIRAAMTPDLAERTESWGWTAQAIRAAPFVTAVPPADGLGERIADLRAMPAPRLAEQLLRPISRAGDTRTALRRARSRGPAVTALVEMLLGRPDVAVADFLAFLDQSRREWFDDEWRRVRPVLAGRARRFADMVTLQGAARALTTLDPSVTPAGTGGAVGIGKVRGARHDVAARGLLVAPSAFIRPHLYVADVPGRPLLIIHPAGAEPPVPAFPDVLRRLETVAHHGRLEVARAIATEPRTAGEIAALWNVDPTLVNRHLRALAAAGLARPSRHGRFVRYRLDLEAVAALGTDLAALLLR